MRDWRVWLPWRRLGRTFLRVKFGVLSIPRAGYASCLCVSWGKISSDTLRGSLHHQKWLLLPGEKTILPSTKPGCLAGTFLRGNAQLLSTALSFSLQPARWGGGQLGGSHIEKLGGPGQPFGLGQGARLWPHPGHSIECRNEQRKRALWHVPLSRS